jgi:hypothetical protein
MTRHICPNCGQEFAEAILSDRQEEALSETGLIDAEFMEAMRDSRYSHEWIGMALRSRMHNATLEAQNAAPQVPAKATSGNDVEQSANLGPHGHSPAVAAPSREDCERYEATVDRPISYDKEETPRTDAFMVKHDLESACHTREDMPHVSNFARQLERELADAHSEIQRICQKQADADNEREQTLSATLPIEPTEDMIRAGVNAWIQMYPRSPIDDCRNVYINIWKAMLKASPSYVGEKSSGKG